MVETVDGFVVTDGVNYLLDDSAKFFEAKAEALAFVESQLMASGQLIRPVFILPATRLKNS